MNGEKAANTAIRRRLALVGYPSFFVVDPADERVALRWVGGFGVRDFPHLLDAGEVAVRGGRTPLAAKLVRADSLYAAGRDSAAAVAYRAALDTAPPDWPERARTVASLLFALSQSDAHADCAALALAEAPRFGRTADAAGMAAIGLDAALQLGAAHPRRAELIGALEPMLVDLAADTTIEMAGDDRSGVHITLVDARTDAQDSVGIARANEAWVAALEREARRAKTPEQRAVYDSHRLSAYIEVHQPERAIPMLQQSERDFPDDYNPPARLAVAYKELKRWDEALAASDRAFARAYGPRKLTLWRTRVDVLLGKGDRDAARRSLEESIAYAEALPADQRSAAMINGLKKRLEGLKEPPK